MSRPFIQIYLCALSEDGKYGGMGAVLSCNPHSLELSHHFSIPVTQNQIEIVAIIKCLEKVKKESNVSIYLDSKSMVSLINDDWPKRWAENDWIKSDGEEVHNNNLWKKMIPLLEKHHVGMRWASDLDNKYDIRAKELCMKALEMAKRFV